MAILRVLVEALALLLALAAAGASLMAQGGRVSPRLDVLSHFAPIYLAAAVLALLIALPLARGGMRTAILATAGIGIVAAAALMAPEFIQRQAGPARDPAAHETLKLVQFNAWGARADIERTYRWLADQDADVYVLEEAGDLGRRFREAGYHVSCRSCGAMVLTRAKPSAIFPPHGYAEDLKYLTASTIADGRGVFTVIGVHRFWPTRFRRAQAQSEAIGELVGRYPRDRLILAGDFNSTPWSFARRREDVTFGLIRRTRALFSWPAAKLSHNRLPAPFPYLPIDHVYAGRGWATVSVTRGPRLYSDHYPVVVVLAPAR